MKKKKKVRIPKGTVQYKSGNHTYIYYAKEKVYDKEHRYNNDKRVCIGTKIDDDFMYANDNYYEFFSSEYEPSEVSSISDTLKIGNVMVVSKIMNDLEMTPLLDEIYGNYSDVLKDILLYMLVTEEDSIQHYESYSFEHPVFSSRALDDNQISEIFQRMEKKDSELFLKAWNALHSDTEEVYISYDSTNVNCAAEGIDMADYGHPKVDVGKPIVNVGLATKQNDGTPLFYEEYDGSIVDVSQCRYMVNRCKQYGYTKIGFLLDRGYFSKKNIEYFDGNGYEFIMMVKGNAKFVQKVMEEVRLSLRLNTKNYLPGHYVSGITKEMKLYKNDKKNRYVHVYYSDERAAQERTKYLEQLEKQKQALDKRVQAKTARRKDLSGYDKHFYLKYDTDGYLETYTQKNTTIQKEADKLGYFVIITSKKMTAEEALVKYRSRDYSEKLNMMFKSELGLYAFRVHKEISMKSKLFVGFLAMIVRNEMYQQLKKLAEREKDRKNYTVPAAIHTLDRFFITRVEDNYCQLYASTKKQGLIFKAFGIDKQYITSFINRVNESLQQSEQN